MSLRIPLRSTTTFLRTNRPTRLFSSIERDPDLEIETFGNLAPWAVRHLQDEDTTPITQILIRHHDERPYSVQRVILSHACKFQYDSDPYILDLTSYPTQSGLTFLFWLFHRRFPTEKDCELPPEPILDMKDDRRFTAKQRGEKFTQGLIHSWALGSFLKAPKFQNDVLRVAARRLSVAEMEVSRSNNPHQSNSIKWSREAFDYTTETDVKESNLSDFAVDVAAKRVYDVGMHGLTLTPEEREALSSNPKFAEEVFGSVVGQTGTKGLGIQDFGNAYLVEEGAEITGCV